MTTPERLRRRQIRESIALAVLALLLAASVVWFEVQDRQQRECLFSYIETDSQTSAIRSSLVRQESEAFRRVIRDAGTATSRESFEAALDRAETSWERIDQEREENPVRRFTSEVCE